MGANIFARGPMLVGAALPATGLSGLAHGINEKRLLPQENPKR
jgi:hypothetical protein